MGQSMIGELNVKKSASVLGASRTRTRTNAILFDAALRLSKVVGNRERSDFCCHGALFLLQELKNGKLLAHCPVLIFELTCFRSEHVE